MSDDIKRLDVAEFRARGYLQEVNRRLLHPLGLALEIHVEADGSERFDGVWDYRDDPEGIVYGPGVIDAALVANVDDDLDRHATARLQLLGSIVQEADQ